MSFKLDKIEKCYLTRFDIEINLIAQSLIIVGESNILILKLEIYR